MACEHKCDNCTRGWQEPEKCLCEDCLEEVKNEAFEEGRKAGLKEAAEEEAGADI